LSDRAGVPPAGITGDGLAGIEMGWASPFEGEDVHVLRGVPTFALEQLVRFFGTSGAFDVATAPQHGLTAIDFRPRLRIGGPTGGAYTALGLEVDAATGQITAHHDSPDPRIDHFSVDIEATIRGRTEPDRLSVLVWLHDAVAEAWMTPSPITLPRAHGTAGSWRTPTILVRFDDGVIGDVTNHPGVVFLAAPPLEVDARGTSITAAEDAPLGATETVNAILPTGLLGLPVVGEAVVGPAWEELSAEQRTVECRPGVRPRRTPTRRARTSWSWPTGSPTRPSNSGSPAASRPPCCAWIRTPGSATASSSGV
jgi:hypothetical protein